MTAGPHAELYASLRAALLDAALAAAAQGWPIFVLGRTKRPVANCPSCRAARRDPAHDPEQCGCLTCHGFYAATRDPDRIHAMFAAFPRGLLAVRTGAASGLVVVDIDPRNGGQLDPALMPPTRAAISGGDGWHLFYRHPGHPIPSRPLPDRPGVDIKADGGLAVLAPSIHPDTRRPYRWLPHPRPVIEMPPALHDLVRADPPRPPDPLATGCRPPGDRVAAAGPVPPPGGGISSPAALRDSILATVTRAPEGRRRTTLYGAARGLARMVTAGALTRDAAETALLEVGRAAEQTDRDIHAAIVGGFHDEGLPT